jgi:hypothetical protein
MGSARQSLRRTRGHRDQSPAHPASTMQPSVALLARLSTLLTLPSPVAVLSRLAPSKLSAINTRFYLPLVRDYLPTSSLGACLPAPHHGRRQQSFELQVRVLGLSVEPPVTLLRRHPPQNSNRSGADPECRIPFATWLAGPPEAVHSLFCSWLTGSLRSLNPATGDSFSLGGVFGQHPTGSWLGESSIVPLSPARI